MKYATRYSLTNNCAQFSALQGIATKSLIFITVHNSKGLILLLAFFRAAK